MHVKYEHTWLAARRFLAGCKSLWAGLIPPRCSQCSAGVAKREDFARGRRVAETSETGDMSCSLIRYTFDDVAWHTGEIPASHPEDRRRTVTLIEQRSKRRADVRDQTPASDHTHDTRARRREALHISYALSIQ